MLRNTLPGTEQWEAKQRVEAAMALPDRLAALKELRRYAGAKFEVSAAVAAGAHLRAGDIAMARKLLKGEDGKGTALQQVRFDVALAANDLEAAAQLVDMTDTETMGTNLERFVVLATGSPRTLLSAPMMLAALICVAILAFFALTPGLLMVPVHYRGLMRRVRGKAALPLFDAIGLRHAWLGAAVVLSVPLLVGSLIEPNAMVDMLGGESVPDAVGLARIMLWGTVAGLLCVIPLVHRMGRRHLVGDRATFRASWRVLIAWGGVVGTALLLGFWNSHTGGGGGETMHTKSMAALAVGGREVYGPVVTMLLVAVLVPIFEELAFRGLILGGLSRHISFGWANTLQALLFAASHDDLPRFPFYLVLGLLAGWLVKKTGSLAPAIALHVLNNAMAFSLRMF